MASQPQAESRIRSPEEEPVCRRLQLISHVLDDEAEKNLRRISYLQATKEAPMEVEEK